MSIKMKQAGYEACYAEIDASQLPTPHNYESFREYFDVAKLNEIRDKYGYPLYRDCLFDWYRLHQAQ